MLAIHLEYKLYANEYGARSAPVSYAIPNENTWGSTNTAREARRKIPGTFYTNYNGKEINAESWKRACDRY